MLLLFIVKDFFVNAELECNKRAICDKEWTDTDIKRAKTVSLDLRLKGVLEVFVLKNVVDGLQTALNEVEGVLHHQCEYFGGERGH